MPRKAKYVTINTGWQKYPNDPLPRMYLEIWVDGIPLTEITHVSAVNYRNKGIKDEHNGTQIRSGSLHKRTVGRTGRSS